MSGKGTFTRKRVDANQQDIFADAAKDGHPAKSTAMIGHGFPDCIIPYAGFTFLFEIKMPGKGLTKDEKIWHEAWKQAGGQVDIIHSYIEAKEIMEKKINDIKQR